MSFFDLSVAVAAFGLGLLVGVVVGSVIEREYTRGWYGNVRGDGK